MVEEEKVGKEMSHQEDAEYVEKFAWRYICIEIIWEVQDHDGQICSHKNIKF